MTCNNICKQYKAKGIINNGRYKNGQKRCQSCCIFIIYDGIRCPCCGYMLRSKPRRKKLKEQLRAAQGVN